MRIKRAYRFLFTFLIILLLTHYILKPYLTRREATRVAQTVLTYLQNDDLNHAYDYWKNPYHTPPFYDLQSYQITKKIFELKDNVQYAKFYIVLNFSKDNILPSGREWIMELSTTSIGWKITDFHLSDTTP